jgi:hypothetical protein
MILTIIERGVMHELIPGVTFPPLRNLPGSGLGIVIVAETLGI